MVTLPSVELSVTGLRAAWLSVTEAEEASASHVHAVLKNMAGKKLVNTIYPYPYPRTNINVGNVVLRAMI
jgi:hypothetical protein